MDETRQLIIKRAEESGMLEIAKKLIVDFFVIENGKNGINKNTINEILDEYFNFIRRQINQGIK